MQKTIDDKDNLIKLYTLLADCYKELDGIKNSLNYYNVELDNCEKINNTHLKIFILLYITELIKLSDQTFHRSNRYFEIYKKALLQAINLIKTSEDNEYISLLPNLKEELKK